MRHRAASAPTSDASSVDSLSRAACTGGGCSIWAAACGGVSDAHGRRHAGSANPYAWRFAVDVI
eukprot:8476378-Pyramimonas_sp.AAC.1